MWVCVCACAGACVYVVESDIIYTLLWCDSLQ